MKINEITEFDFDAYEKTIECMTDRVRALKYPQGILSFHDIEDTPEQALNYIYYQKKDIPLFIKLISSGDVSYNESLVLEDSFDPYTLMKFVGTNISVQLQTPYNETSSDNPKNHKKLAAIYVLFFDKDAYKHSECTDKNKDLVKLRQNLQLAYDYNHEMFERCICYVAIYHWPRSSAVKEIIDEALAICYKTEANLKRLYPSPFENTPAKIEPKLLETINTVEDAVKKYLTPAPKTNVIAKKSNITSCVTKFPSPNREYHGSDGRKRAKKLMRLLNEQHTHLEALNVLRYFFGKESGPWNFGSLKPAVMGALYQKFGKEGDQRSIDLTHTKDAIIFIDLLREKFYPEQTTKYDFVVPYEEGAFDRLLNNMFKPF